MQATSLGLPSVVRTSVAQGHFLNAATARLPVAVLGATAAWLLGIDRVFSGERIWVGGQWFYVAGILRPAVLAPQIDTSVLVGFASAERYLGFGGHPTTIYVRAQTSQVDAVHAILAATANPGNPGEVSVSQPSAALVAQADAQSAFDSLFLGLGVVALLVGAVGVGAGVLATAVYASVKGWAIVVPVLAWGGGIAAALVIGAVAGLVPAIRAARLSPTRALWSV